MITEINRITAPELKHIEHLDIRRFNSYTLGNGVNVYRVDSHEDELVRLELRFRAGKWYEPSPAISRSICNLMKKGTTTKTAQQIADATEFYGTQIETQNGYDFTSVAFLTLAKHVKHILPIVEEVLTEATFPEDELALFTQKQKQKLRINAQNTDFHANRKFNEVLFGANHPYGYAIQEAHFDALSIDELKKYHKQHYSPALATLFVAGKITDELLALIEKHFGVRKNDHLVISATDKSIHTDADEKFFIQKEDSVQSSIRIGGLSVGKTHPDFPELNVLNSVFGGYFGSRLMSNVREDKGYTYGIYSSITHNQYGSYFSIDTEVGNEVCEAALKEIYFEMDQLRNVLIDDEELTIVKNYMMGSLLRATDGPYNRINVIKNIVMSGLDTDYFHSLVHAIKTVTPGRLRELANRYLVKEEMKEVICGKR